MVRRRGLHHHRKINAANKTKRGRGIYADKVKSKPLTRKPHFIGGLFAVCLAVFWALDFADTAAARPLAGLFGGGGAEGEESGRLSAAVLLAALFAANIFLLGFLPARAQVFAVWAELAAAFIGFFLLFNLSFEFIASKLWVIISKGLWTTVYISAISIAVAFVLAIVAAVAKLSGNGFAYAIASFYTSLFRGLPLLMQLYLIYLGLPQLGFVVTAVPAGIAALSLCYGAYMAEIFRAGIESIPRGQWEGSRAMGLKFFPMMRLVILPQAVPVIIPPTGNQFIAMIKDSSLVSVIGVWELMFLAKKLGSKTFQHMEMLITVAVIYWLLTIALEVAQERLERHYQKQRN